LSPGADQKPAAQCGKISLGYKAWWLTLSILQTYIYVRSGSRIKRRHGGKKEGEKIMEWIGDFLWRDGICWWNPNLVFLHPVFSDYSFWSQPKPIINSVLEIFPYFVNFDEVSNLHLL
jgi:hypothetical protein